MKATVALDRIALKDTRIIMILIMIKIPNILCVIWIYNNGTHMLCVPGQKDQKQTIRWLRILFHAHSRRRGNVG